MTVVETVEQDLKESMKAKDELSRSVLRLMQTALKNKRIDLGRAPTDDEAQAVLKTMKKQYEDALVDFEKGGRNDLAERQKRELVIVNRYLPAALPEAELERIVAEAVRASGVTSEKEAGKAMGIAMKAVAGRAEGNAVRAIVQRLLGGAPTSS
jgi:hypothetical protein